MNLKNDNVLELDGLKGLAILLIMLFSCFWFPYSFELILPPPPGHLDYWLQGFLGSGWIGLDLFMVLTGFFATNELLENFNFREFYIRRLRRLVPAYFLLLAIWFGVVLALRPTLLKDIDWLSLASVWTFTSNILLAFSGDGSRIPDPLYHLWTIALVAQFFLLWPLVFKIAGGRQRMVWACAALIFLLPLLRGLVIYSDDSLRLTALMFTPLRLDSFAWGALLSLVGDRILGRKAVALTSLLSFAVLAAFFALRPGLNQLDPLVLTGGFSLLGLFFASTVALILPLRPREPRNNPLAKVLNFPLINSLGRYSYGLYLVHQPVTLMLLYSAYLPGPGWTPFIVFSGLCMGLSLLIAMLSFQSWERRFLSAE